MLLCVWDDEGLSNGSKAVGPLEILDGVSNGMGPWDWVPNLSVLQIFPPFHLPSPTPTLFTPKLQCVVPQTLSLMNTGLKAAGVRGLYGAGWESWLTV